LALVSGCVRKVNKIFHGRQDVLEGILTTEKESAKDRFWMMLKILHQKVSMEDGDDFRLLLPADKGGTRF
jgi:hypothetical protein